MIEVLVFVFFLIIFACLFIYALPALLTIGPVPTPRRVAKRILSEAQLKPTDVFYDLGAGDGRLLIEAVENYHCKAVGYELMMPVYLIARLKIFLSGQSQNIRLYFRDFYAQDLSKADVIFCYLIPNAMKILEKKFKEKPPRSGTRIISYTFPIKGWKPRKIIRVDRKSYPVFIYRVD